MINFFAESMEEIQQDWSTKYQKWKIVLWLFYMEWLAVWLWKSCFCNFFSYLQSCDYWHLDILFQYNLLGYFERHLFRSSSASHAATSIVDMNAMNRGDILNIYVKNWDVLSFSNEVVISYDMFATREVIWSFSYCYVISYLLFERIWKEMIIWKAIFFMLMQNLQIRNGHLLPFNMETKRIFHPYKR